MNGDWTGIMTISGILPYAGFYEYNSIKANELRAEQIAATQKASSVEAEEVSTETQGATVQTPAPEQNFTAFDYAQNYRSDETHELKGRTVILQVLTCRKQSQIWIRIRYCSSISSLLVIKIVLPRR